MGFFSTLFGLPEQQQETMPCILQPEFVWFAKGEAGPSDEEKRAWVSDVNPELPLNRFIGNAQAVNRFRRMVYTALGRHNRCCSDLSLAVIGPPSVGKTTLVKLFAESLGLPFVELNGRQVTSLNDIFLSVYKVLKQMVGSNGVDLTLVDLGENEYRFPPCIIFIDEVHALRSSVVDGLLKPTEQNDGQMTFRGNKYVYHVDCRDVCWIIGTTDRGKLFDAFDTRFSKVYLEMYTVVEIATIVKLHNNDLPNEACALAARFAGTIPREALDFATEMKLDHDMTGSSWDIVARRIAEERGIDQYGMTYQRLDILKALCSGPIPLKRLPNVAHCKVEELEKFILPPLLAFTEDREALITVGSRGFEITSAGVEELCKRGFNVRSESDG